MSDWIKFDTNDTSTWPLFGPEIYIVYYKFHDPDKEIYGEYGMGLIEFHDGKFYYDYPSMPLNGDVTHYMDRPDPPEAEE